MRDGCSTQAVKVASHISEFGPLHSPSRSLSLSAAVTHTVILQGDDGDVEEFIHIHLQRREKTVSASLMSLHLALWSLIARLGHLFQTSPQIRDLFRHHQWRNNVPSQTCRHRAFNPPLYKDAALFLPTPALGIGP